MLCVLTRVGRPTLSRRLCSGLARLAKAQACRRHGSNKQMRNALLGNQQITKERQGQTDRDRQRQTDRDRQRQTETDRQTDRDRDRQRQTKTDRDDQCTPARCRFALGCEGCGSEADPAQGPATMAREGAPQTQAITAWVEVTPDDPIGTSMVGNTTPTETHPVQGDLRRAAEPRQGCNRTKMTAKPETAPDAKVRERTSRATTSATPARVPPSTALD